MNQLKHSSNHSSDATILVVDDEVGIQEILTFFLESQGYKVLVAGSGNSAFQIIQERKIDLVISDIKMPDGTGIELMEKVSREIESGPKIVILTGFSVYTSDEVLELGAAAVLAKPVTSESLCSAVRRILNGDALIV